MRFSKSTGCFYPESEQYAVLPDDIITVPEADYDAAMAREPGDTLDVIRGRVVVVPRLAPTDADVAAQVRADRDARMRAFEWRYERHARETRLAQPTTDKLADLDAHMQALANVPEQAGFPRGVKWPVYPPVTEPKQVAAPTGGAK